MLTGCTGPGGDIVIPGNVKAIGSRVFEKNSTITSVVIPGNVKRVRFAAFLQCTSLKTVTMEEGVDYIDNCAFSNCTSLKTVVLPNDGVSYLGSAAFSECYELESVNIPNGVKEIQSLTFNACRSLKALTIPDSVTTIEGDSLIGCASLKTITIPDSVTALGLRALCNCASLETVIISKNVKAIEDRTFANCVSMKNVTFTENVETIGKDVFFGCSGLTSVTILNNSVDISAASIDKSVLIRAYTGSKAEKFAKTNGNPFESLGVITEPAGGVEVFSDTSGICINLSDETIELNGFAVAAYSLDGGKKWKKGALPSGDKFTKLFNKNMTLWLIDSADTKGKPTDESEYVKFPAIKARPKANADKLKATYMDDENWWLAKKSDTSGAEVYSGYEYTVSSSGKVSSSSVWAKVPQGGFALITGKTKTTYIFRSAATANSDGSYTPAGKTFKLKPANYGSATKYKINYKTEVLKLKKGDGYSTDGISYTAVTEAKGIELDVGAYITAGTVIYVRKEATGKKPPTEVQEIVPYERLELSSSTLTCQRGKITSNMKEYELYDTARKKWVSVPKTADSGTYEIRLKTTAKTTGGNAASEAGTLVVTCGEYEEDKTGVIQAMITPD